VIEHVGRGERGLLRIEAAQVRVEVAVGEPVGDAMREAHR
jgi:hypothetical protein